jgi:hypothetical protein
MTRYSTSERAYEAITAAGVHPNDAQRVLAALSGADISLADAKDDELVCRWVNIQTQAVPPDADTIIRTITTTRAEQSLSSTHWLEGLRAPRNLPQFR